MYVDLSKFGDKTNPYCWIPGQSPKNGAGQKKQTTGECSLPSSTELILPDAFLPSQHHDAAGARHKNPRSSPDEENSKEVEILGEWTWEGLFSQIIVVHVVSTT